MIVNINKLKICSKCNIEKSLDEFFSGKYNHWCKSCRYEYARKDYKKKKPLERKYINAKRNYRLDKEKFLDLMKITKCEICKKELNDLSQKKIDYCHDTKIIRGVLCNHCNLMIGHANHSPEILMSAIKYLMIERSK